MCHHSCNQARTVTDHSKVIPAFTWTHCADHYSLTMPSIQFIKGYKIDRKKIAEGLGSDLNAFVDTGIIQAIEFLPRESYKFIGCGTEGNNRPVVIVLDYDYDEETLRRRPLAKVDPTILWIQPILEGPDVWVRAV